MILRRAPWIAMCLPALDEHTALDLTRRHQISVAVVDVSGRGPFIGTLVRALREASPGIRLVLTSTCATLDPAVLRAARPTSVIAPGSSAREVLQAVYAARHTTEREATRLDRPHGLTDRERQVLDRLGTGATNREIAGELHLSAEAVKKHASAIYRKLGVRNRTEASRRAQQALAHRP